MHVLLVGPDYYTSYSPLGLLKIGAYHRIRGDTIELVRGLTRQVKAPNLIYVTRLFTYAWKPIHEAVAYHKLLAVGGCHFHSWRTSLGCWELQSALLVCL